jgi:hypothetical protein
MTGPALILLIEDDEHARMLLPAVGYRFRLPATEA